MTELKPPISALIFDLGGVIIDIDFSRVFEVWVSYAREDPIKISNRFSMDEAYARHEIGEIHYTKYFSSLRQSLKIDITDQEFIQGWNEIFKGEMPGIAVLLENIAARYPVFAFTNTNHLHQSVWSDRYQSVLKPFTKIYSSVKIGLRKPEARAFKYVIDDCGFNPENILFLDDSLDNVLGAKAAGLQAAHVKSTAEVWSTLKAL